MCYPVTMLTAISLSLNNSVYCFHATRNHSPGPYTITLSFTGDNLRVGHLKSKTTSGKPKLFVTHGYGVALKGTCVFFTRNDPATAITADNFSKVCMSSALGHVFLECPISE